MPILELLNLLQLRGDVRFANLCMSKILVTLIIQSTFSQQKCPRNLQTNLWDKPIEQNVQVSKA